MDKSQKLTAQDTQDEDKQDKKTTQYVLDTTIRKQRKSHFKQLAIQTNRTSFYAEIVPDITTRNSEHKDT